MLGIDYGGARTGVAVSDPLGWTAQGLETVKGGMDGTTDQIIRIAKQYGAKTIVVGYPVNMNGSAGYQAERTDKFIEALKDKLGEETADVVKWDERLTSAEAAKILKTSGARPTSRAVRENGKLDMLSASILLQSYLDNKRLAAGKPGNK